MRALIAWEPEQGRSGQGSPATDCEAREQPPPRARVQ
jgi:hypothetical protein